MSKTYDPKKEAEKTSEDMMLTLLGGGNAGKKTLVILLDQTRVFEMNIKPEDVEARNAGMRMLYDMVGGPTPESGRKLVKALVKGLGYDYEAFKEGVHEDSSDQQ
jgi:hypothetical protein